MSPRLDANEAILWAAGAVEAAPPMHPRDARRLLRRLQNRYERFVERTERLVAAFEHDPAMLRELLDQLDSADRAVHAVLAAVNTHAERKPTR